MPATISILIPTRNRPLLARLAVETALANSDADCEIVVADNSDTPLDLPKDPRLRHLTPPGKPLGMPDNWERALEAASGQWVMLLSDKYMLVPQAIDALRAQVVEGAEVVTYGYGVLRQALSQADAEDPLRLGTAGGKLQLPPQQPVRVRQSQQMLEAIYRQPARYPDRAPMLYTALVARTAIERARSHTGRFFFGPCPDVASALQVLSHTAQYLETQIPAIMVQYPSQSAEWSTGASTLVGGDVGRRFLRHLGDLGPGGSLSLVSSLIFQTIRSAPPSALAVAGVEPSWPRFAWEAAREIEGLPLLRKPRLHLGLLLVTQRPRLRPIAAWMQLRAALGYNAPQLLVRAYARVVRRPPVERAEAALSPVDRDVASRDEALVMLRSALPSA